MRHKLARRFSAVLTVVSIAILLTLISCGGRPDINPTLPSNMAIVISDDPTGDWATIGIKIQSIALTPQGGGAPITVYTAPNPVPVFNLVQLNQLGEVLANAQVPAGSYTAATLTLFANPGDVTLTASADPEPGFAGTPGASVPASQIEIVGAQGNAGSMTLPLQVSFDSPLVVKGNTSNALNIDFDLSHPAFLVAHVPPTGPTIWSVNFGPACHERKVDDITRLVLRHIYGTV